MFERPCGNGQIKQREMKTRQPEQWARIKEFILVGVRERAGFKRGRPHQRSRGTTPNLQRKGKCLAGPIDKGDGVMTSLGGGGKETESPVKQLHREQVMHPSRGEEGGGGGMEGCSHEIEKERWFGS